MRPLPLMICSLHNVKTFLFGGLFFELKLAIPRCGNRFTRSLGYDEHGSFLLLLRPLGVHAASALYPSLLDSLRLSKSDRLSPVFLVLFPCPLNLSL